MKDLTRNILLAIVVVLIVVAIALLERPRAVTKGIALRGSAQPNTVASALPNPNNQSRILSTNNTADAATTAARRAQKAAQYPPAIELASPDAYLNSAPFNLSEYIGKKVILLDFWTYSCINCLRTLPYLTAWDAKYRDEGLLIVGIHSPEFAFEKDAANVEKAIAQYGIAYPVVLDNEHQTWSAYQNNYWPRHYLIDIDGYIVEDHIGEGGYVETEAAIQRLLEERRAVLGLDTSVDTTMANVTPQTIDVATEEVYLGYGYGRGQIGNREGWQPGAAVTYAAQGVGREEGKFYLTGRWRNNQDNMESMGDAAIILKYRAQSVNVVAGASSPTPIEVFVDGTRVANITVSDYRLYQLYNASFGTHEVELRGKDVQIFTFTFG